MIDVNQPVTNPVLKERLRDLCQENTQEHQARVLEEIAMNAKFLSVVELSQEPRENGDGTATFQQEAAIRFPMLTTGTGELYYPAFTDWEELARWGRKEEKPKTFILSFDDYAALVLRNEDVAGVAINPFDENLVLDRQMLEHLRTQKELLRSGITRQEIQKDTEVMLGDPQQPPIQMLEAVRAYLKEQPAVHRAWLRLMVKEGEQSFLMVVDLDGVPEGIFGGIVQAAQSHLGEMCLDLVPFETEFGRQATEDTAPFYQE